jgi:hypothetical protein
VLVSELFLTEAPIEDLSLVGDWSKNSSFRRPTDRALLQNPKGQAKIIHKWEKTVIPFNIYFINMPEAWKHKEVGEVSHEWVQQNLPNTYPQLKLRDDACNILYTNNVGDQWMPMTGWVAAHRFAHVIKRLPEFQEMQRYIFGVLKRILVAVYGKQEPHRYDFERQADYNRMMTKFVSQIGTFRSARENKIRNEYEFIYELVAQYMITGSVKFNPLPRSFAHGRMAWGRPTRFAYAGAGLDKSANQDLENLAGWVNDACEELMHNCVGRIFVM